MDLPTWRSTFVGRRTEKKALLARLDAGRLVTVIGPGGGGKSRLAGELARDRVEDLDRGPWFVALAPIADSAGVPGAIRSAVGAHEQAWRDPLDTVTDWIGDEAALVVIDNCEHVLGGARTAIGRLVDRCPNLTVLVTSREPLGVEGEAIFVLPALETPPAGAEPTAAVTYDAVELFVDRARLGQQDFEISPEAAATIAELVRRLDGMPLAIELAAARVSMMSVDQILHGLDDRFRLLTRTTHVDDARHQTLVASVDWSHDLLAADEQALLRRLAVFAGSFSLAAVEDVTSWGVVDRTDVLDLLANLVAKSMVVVDRSDARATRYRLLETFRAYGWRRVAEAGEEHELRTRHLGWALDLVATAEIELADRNQHEWLDLMEREHDNLREALAFATSDGQIERALAMAAGMNLFWKLHSHFGEAKATLAALLDQAPADGLERRAAEWALADVCSWMGDNDESIRRARAVLEASRAVGDDRFAARALWTLANVNVQVDPSESRAAAAEAQVLAQASGDPWLQGVTLQVAGLLARYEGTYGESRAFIDRALELASEHDIPQLVAWCWVVLQPSAVDHGDFHEADRCYELGMAAATTIRDPVTTAQLLEPHADGMVQRGRPAEARSLLEQAVADLDASGARSFSPFLHHRLVVTLAGLDDDAAAEEIDPILELPVPSPGAVMYADLARAWVAVARSDPSAESTAQAAVDWSQLLGHPRLVSEHLVLLGLTRLATNPAAAANAFHEALTAAYDAGFLPWVADALDGIAACDDLRGDHEVALRIRAGAARLRHEIGSVRHLVIDRVLGPIEPPADGSVDRRGETSPVAVPEPTLAETVRYARRNRGRRNRPTAGWESLTPSEEQVVVLVAEGLTNRDIASRLFVSIDTVKTHVSHAFAKLGVANRTELAAAVARRAG